MLTLLLGTDAARAKERLSALDGHAPSTALPAHIELEQLVSLAQSASLFGEPSTYVLSGLFEDEAKEEELLAALPVLAHSEHLFLLEEESGASLAKAVEKAKGTVIRAKAEAKKEVSDPFALAGALGKRDKRELWLLYRKAIDEGAAPEQLIGMLAWKARQMLGKDGSEASRNLSRDLIAVYHEARRGGGEMELLLERLILTL